MKKSKAMCLFCGRSHKTRPSTCKAKVDIFQAYLKRGVELWQVMAGIKMGHINLDTESKRLVNARKKHPRAKYVV